MTTEATAIGVRPVPRIDHIMVLLDEKAYRDVAETDFLGERFGRLTRKQADSSVAGAYATLGIAGENTLVELFGGTIPGGTLTGGLVFSFEAQGSATAARQVLDAAAGVEYHHDLVRRAVAGSVEPQPWYHLISVNMGEASPLVLFLNEVTPEYLRSLGARPAEDGSLRRRDYLDAALGGPAGPPRLMRDISGVTLALSPARARRLAGALCPFGFEMSERDGEQRLRGPDLTIVTRVDDTAPQGVLEIQIDLVEGRHEPAEHRFGETSRLVIDPSGVAVWSFAPIS
ncbi:MAG TPA: DUF5829 family protein [Mycobacteriales bacterium]|nr:DUF5829 family protein [Mycobacteriales bacterium]